MPKDNCVANVSLGKRFAARLEVSPEQDTCALHFAAGSIQLNASDVPLAAIRDVLLPLLLSLIRHKRDRPAS